MARPTAGDSTDRRAQARRVVRGLAALYPNPECALVHRSPFELLVATILSAQCTDARVNLVTPALFARFPDAASLAGAELPGGRDADPLRRLLPGQGQEPRRDGPRRWSSCTAARSRATSTR